MAAKWKGCIFLASLLAVMAGCRSPQPNLKPDKSPEQFVSPPQEPRYDSSGYPKQAMDPLTDPAKEALDAKNAPGAPSRGMMSSGAGGMSSGR